MLRLLWCQSVAGEDGNRELTSEAHRIPEVQPPTFVKGCIDDETQIETNAQHLAQTKQEDEAMIAAKTVLPTDRDDAGALTACRVGGAHIIALTAGHHVVGPVTRHSGGAHAVSLIGRHFV